MEDIFHTYKVIKNDRRLIKMKSEMSSQTGSIFPLVLTLHTMTRNLIIGDCHVCLTTVLDQSRLISVALSIDFLVKK